ncbi:hypothetical protein DPX16_3689 [Anabarilius grahami]|uniref:Uncharacterized protein n=1 Tax=Anabarilius grahami TaxID=495550 RepID=A0A3N0YK09_ANAGA|nr:hypothetical protein DPX16_3689 [Anabarilius grahami]
MGNDASPIKSEAVKEERRLPGSDAKDAIVLTFPSISAAFGRLRDGCQLSSESWSLTSAASYIHFLWDFNQFENYNRQKQFWCPGLISTISEHRPNYNCADLKICGCVYTSRALVYSHNFHVQECLFKSQWVLDPSACVYMQTGAGGGTGSEGTAVTATPFLNSFDVEHADMAGTCMNNVSSNSPQISLQQSFRKNAQRHRRFISSQHLLQAICRPSLQMSFVRAFHMLSLRCANERRWYNFKRAELIGLIEDIKITCQLYVPKPHVRVTAGDKRGTRGISHTEDGGRSNLMWTGFTGQSERLNGAPVGERLRSGPL